MALGLRFILGWWMMSGFVSSVVREWTGVILCLLADGYSLCC